MRALEVLIGVNMFVFDKYFFYVLNLVFRIIVSYFI